MGLLSRTLLGGAVGSGMGYLLSPEEQKIEGAIAGGLGGAGGGLLSRFVMIDPTKLGTFGGSLGARNLASKGVVGPQQALTMAEEMAARGASRDEIWDATAKHLDGTPYAGVFKGVDGKWRFEIDDSGANLTGAKKGPLGSVMKHPELYKAYPDAARVQTQIGGQGGAYIPAGRYNDEIIQASPNDTRSIVLHEAGGHGVQHREGFAQGGATWATPEYAKEQRQLASALVEIAYRAEKYPQETMEDLLIAAQNITDASDDVVRQAYKVWKEAGQPTEAAARDVAMQYVNTAKNVESLEPFEVYRRLAGEAEARNVQTRDAMRRRGEKPGRPWETQDVPDDQQIVRFGAGK